jgi:hypothetical protein
MSVAPRSQRGNVATALWLILVASESCRLPADVPVADARHATLVAIDDFFERYGGGNWPRIYLSDEHVQFSVDRLFIERLRTGGVPVEVAHRADVEVSADTIRDGALLLEPSNLVRNMDGSVSLHLVFSQTSQFGGELLYTVRQSWGGRWLVTGLKVVWIT